MTYLDYLKCGDHQYEIEKILEKYKSQPVGYGYIDLITHFDQIENLINELTSIGVAINGVTWWCHTNEDNKKLYNCPHGLGGPSSIFFNGWFSEMGPDYESFDPTQEVYDQFEAEMVTQGEINILNESVRRYIKDFKKNDLFEDCFYPAIWLHVPREWRRLNYLI
ncbi:hypothetical protein [Paenibacillus agaridevorans]|uniref:hypothetical protein n=1 Tax=Paenibacillus agaridevorans TaxID=171404 RepID=UPI001BE4972A|nr:hypothetical protein [Paenibacillus agaridevorans]